MKTESFISIFLVLFSVWCLLGLVCFTSTVEIPVEAPATYEIAASDFDEQAFQTAEGEYTEEETPEAVDILQEATLIQNCKLTFYCACKRCCGKSDGITASGAHVEAGVTVAVDPDVIPLGSTVIINGHEYIAQDTGGSIKENRIDIYVEDHQEALNLGVQYADVYFIPPKGD